MRIAHHSPAYVAHIRNAWRVVVPIRGRLSPRVLAREFPNEAAAAAWLSSEEGQSIVEMERTARRCFA